MSGYIGYRKVPTVNSGSGVWPLNEVAKFKNDRIWPSVDPYFQSVSLLLHGDGENNSTVFIDSSFSPNTITVNGGAKISTSIKKYGAGSMYFDGSGDWLTVASGVANFGTGDFTVEAWVYLTGSSGGYPSLVSAKNATSPQFSFVGTSNIIFYNGTTSYSYNYSPGINQWAHVAWVRSSGTFYIYVNGTSVGSFAYTSAIDLNDVMVGSYYNGSLGNGDFQGYVDDLRITKGVARYTGNFTPPTAPFPNN